MNLKDRLEKIESLRRKVQQISGTQRDKSFQFHQNREPVPISDMISGNHIDTPYGPCFYGERKFPLNTAMGDSLLSEIADYFPGVFATWIPESGRTAEDIRLNQTLFFDTETTGLAGGAGNFLQIQ